VSTNITGYLRDLIEEDYVAGNDASCGEGRQHLFPAMQIANRSLVVVAARTYDSQSAHPIHPTAYCMQ
jgi:hypothetical protein